MRCSCSPLRLHDPAHQKNEASTVARKIWMRLAKGVLVHPRSSQLAQKVAVALANLFSTSTSKLLSKVISVPSTLKPTSRIDLRVGAPLTWMFSRRPQSCTT